MGDIAADLVLRRRLSGSAVATSNGTQVRRAVIWPLHRSRGLNAVFLQFTAGEKIRIVLEGLRGDESIAELCRREGIASLMYYGWSKEFLEVGQATYGRRHGQSCYF